MGRRFLRLSVRRLMLAVALVAIYLVISRVTSPTDWVDVTVGPLPDRTEFFCLVAEDAEGVGALPWYHAKVFPFTMDPSMSVGYWSAGGFVTASVQWRGAKRYGVLTRGRDGWWRLWWLGSRELEGPSAMRYILGGGKAEMHLPAESPGLVPSEDFLKNLGLAAPRGR